MGGQRTAPVWCAVLLAFCTLWPAVGGAQNPDPEARTFIDALNQRRTTEGVPALRLNSKLLADAETAAAQLANSASLQLDLVAQKKRLRQARYPWRRITSVAANGAADPNRLLQAYLARDSVRKSLLSIDYSEVGVGIAAGGAASGEFWVVTLAEPYAAARPGWRSEVIEHVNRFRARNGLPGLVGNDTLDRMAQGHSEDMAARGYFAHDSPDGRTVGDRAAEAGYKFRTLSENLAGGKRRPGRVVEGWINSPPHREAMLNPDIEEAGVGYVFHPFDDATERLVHYWTLNMGKR